MDAEFLNHQQFILWYLFVLKLFYASFVSVGYPLGFSTNQRKSIVPVAGPKAAATRRGDARGRCMVAILGESNSKCQVLLSDLPVIRCIVWVGNIMTLGWCWLVDWLAWFLLVAPHKSGSKANRSNRENHNDTMMTRRRLHANTGSYRTRTIFNLRMKLRNEQLYMVASKNRGTPKWMVYNRKTY